MKQQFLKLGILLLIIINFTAKAENIQALLKADTNAGLIGDQIKLRLEVRFDKNLHVIMPLVPDSLGKIEIVSSSKIDTISSSSIDTMRQTFVITSFDSGMVVVPPFTVMYEKQGFQDPFPVLTDSIILKISGIAVDTTKEYKDIKGPMTVGLTWADLLPYILIFLGIVVLGLIGFYIWKRLKKKPVHNLKFDPTIPAHISALEALRLLDSEKLWQKGQVKEYYIRLTEIIRLYVERRFEFPALEMVTDEIDENLRKISLDTELIHKFIEMLRDADLVKFAKVIPIPDENSLAMTISIEFINRTTIIT